MEGRLKMGEEYALNNRTDRSGGDTDESIRVPSECQAIFRLIDSKESERSERAVSSALFHVPPFPAMGNIDPSEKLYEKRDELDADLVELLLCLDWKMNLLIKTLSPLRDEAIYPHRAVILTMSTEWLRILTSEPLTVGALLEFQCILPILPFKELFLRGTVVCVSGTPCEYEVALQSDHLKASDREHLIHYIVKRQFQSQRERLKKK